MNPPPSPILKPIMNVVDDNQDSLIPGSSSNPGISMYRRTVCLVFNEAIFDLLIQIPWVKRVTRSIIEVKFYKELANNTRGNIGEINQRVQFEIVLRLSLQFISPENTEYDPYQSIESYLDQSFVKDEISLKLSPGFLIISEKSLPSSWNQFLTKS